MKKHFVKFIAMLLVCLFAISGVNFSMFAAGETAELGEKLSAMNVEVSGKISLMFYFKNLKDVAYFKVTVPNRDGSSTTNTVEVSDLRYDSTKDRYLLKVALAAAQQTDKVSIQAFNGSDVGSSKTYQYSIKDYADRVFALAETNKAYEAVARAIKSMLNYGAMAQTYFEYKLESLANIGLYGKETNPVDNMSDNDMYGIGDSSSYTTNSSIINFTAVNAYLEDMVCLRFYLDYNGAACAVEDLKVFVNSVEYKNEVVQDENGDYYILINNIPATCFNDQYQVKISDGTEYAVTSYSVFNYLQRKLELTQNEAFADVVYSMFQFYVSTSTHTDRDIPGFDSMEAVCTHERTYIDSIHDLFICSDCGEVLENLGGVANLDIGYAGAELLGKITDKVLDSGIESAELCENEYVRVTSGTGSDQYIGFDLGGSANVGSYMVVRYRTATIPKGNVNVQVFATTGSTGITGSGDWFYTYGIVADGRWHTLVIDLTASSVVASGNGMLGKVRFDIFDAFPANAVIDFGYIGFCDNISDVSVEYNNYFEYGIEDDAKWQINIDSLSIDGSDASKTNTNYSTGAHQSAVLEGYSWKLGGWVAVNDQELTDMSICVLDESGEEHWTKITNNGTTANVANTWWENSGITSNALNSLKYGANTVGYRMSLLADLTDYAGQTVNLSIRVVTAYGYAVTIYSVFVTVPMGAKPGCVSGEEMAAGVTDAFSTELSDGSVTFTNTAVTTEGTTVLTHIIDRTSKYAVIRYKTTDDTALYVYATTVGKSHTGVKAELKNDGKWHVVAVDLEGASYTPGDAIALFRLDTCESAVDASITIDYLYLCDDLSEVSGQMDHKYKNHVDHIYADGDTDNELKESTSVTGTTIDYVGWTGVNYFSADGISCVITDSAGNETKFDLKNSEGNGNVYYKGSDAIQNAVTGTGWSPDTVGYVVKFTADLFKWAGQTVTLSIRVKLPGGGTVDTYSLTVEVPAAPGTLDAEPAADFTVSKVFSDYMVVQRGEHIRVWGFAPESENGKKISAEFKGMVAETLIENGEWCITFTETLEADTVGADMTIYAGTNKTVTFSDVLVGDVYLVLGQSNAALTLSETISGSGISVDIDENSIIRLNFLNGGGGTYAEKGTDYVYKDLENTTLWTKTTEAQANRFSAIGYHFAQEMVERSDNTVPVGLMEVAVGGAPLASFLPNDLAELYDSDYYNAETGKYVSMRDASHLGRYLYNCYLAPASRYSVAGVLWYQGESDNPLNFAQVYGDAFGDLIDRLRSTHNVINTEFPVFAVEFPTQYQKPEDYSGSDTWHYLEVGTIRTYQGLLPTTVDNFYLAASSDLWSDSAYANSLHPYCKAAQAERLADIAEFVIFGNGSLDEATGPIYQSHEISADGKTVVITFSNVGAGLTTADGGTAVKGLLGFADKPYVISTVTPASATVTSTNQITVVFSEAVKSVVYNYNTSDFYGDTLNLCNSAKIPALAFITPYEEGDLGSYESGDFMEKTDGSLSHVSTSIDTMKANGTDLFTVGKVVAELTAAGNRVSLTEGTTMLSVSGWTGFGCEALMFGYSIDGNNAIFNTYPSDPGDAVINAGGQYAKRFAVNMDISGLAAGDHTVDVLVLVNVNDGTAVKLLSFTIVIPEPSTVNNINAIYPAEGEEVVLANDLIYNFWQTFDNTSATYPAIVHEDRYYPVPVDLQWSCKEDASYYLVYVSLNEDLSDAMSFVSNVPTVQLENLFVGYDYYWQVDAICGDQTLRSEIFTFSTAISPRTVVIEGVSNTRDIGGYITADGNRIKQGMIYRGGKLNDITEKGKQQFLYELGIKTDLDLRNSTESGGILTSPVSDDIKYQLISGRYYVESVTGDNGINSEIGKPIMAEEIRLFAVPENFPIYIHCSLGRDRTGTLVFILQALCGMEERDLIMDYELSIFSVTGTLDNGNPVDSIKATYTYINNEFAGETFAEKTENYLLSIGITAEEIATIRSLLIEEVQ